MKILGIAAAAAVFITWLTGTMEYIEYRLSAPDTAKSKVNKLFLMPKNHCLDSWNIAGLAGTMWAGVMAYLAWHYRENVHKPCSQD